MTVQKKKLFHLLIKSVFPFKALIHPVVMVIYNTTESFFCPLSVADSTLRVRRARWLVLSMLSLSTLLVALGVYTTTRAESLNVSGYGSGVIVSSVRKFSDSLLLLSTRTRASPTVLPPETQL